MKLCRHAGVDEATGVFQILFEKQVERPDRNECGRQAAQIGRARRHRINGNIRSPWLHSEQRAPPKAVARRGPHELTAIRMRARIGNTTGAVIEHCRIQQLETHSKLAAPVRELGERCSVAATGALTGDGNSGAIDTQLLSFRMEPPQCRIAILESTRESGFRCQAVVDRGDYAADSCHERAIQGVVDFRSTEHIAATVYVKNGPAPGGAAYRRDVQEHAYVGSPRWTRHEPLLAGDRPQFGRESRLVGERQASTHAAPYPTQNLIREVERGQVIQPAQQLRRNQPARTANPTELIVSTHYVPHLINSGVYYRMALRQVRRAASHRLLEGNLEQMERPEKAEMTIEAELRIPAARLQVVRYLQPEPVSGALHEDEEYRLDLSLTPRPRNARARYLNRWSPHRFERLGTVWLLPPGETLQATSDGVLRQRSLVCHLRPEQMREWIQHDLEWTDRRLAAILDIPDANIRGLLLRLAEEVRHPGFASEVLVELICAQIAIELGRYCAGVNEGPITGGLAPWRLRLIDERLREVKAAPTLAELADLCKLSVRQLTRGFRVSRGCSIGDHVARSRLDHAKRLLASDESVKGIAYSLGFSSPSSFSYAFRRLLGETPRQFRQRVLRAG